MMLPADMIVQHPIVNRVGGNDKPHALLRNRERRREVWNQRHHPIGLEEDEKCCAPESTNQRLAIILLPVHCRFLFFTFQPPARPSPVPPHLPPPRRTNFQPSHCPPRPPPPPH